MLKANQDASSAITAIELKQAHVIITKKKELWRISL